MSGLSIARVQEHIDNLQKLVDIVKVSGSEYLDESQCLRVAETAQRLRILVNPPNNVGFEITMMPYIATSVRLALDLGIFKSLSVSSPQTSDDLARRALAYTQAPDVDADFIARIMRLVTLYGLADEAAPLTYSANATTIALGEPDSGLRSLLEHFYDFYMPVLDHSLSYFAARGYTLPTDPHVGPFQSFYQTDKGTYDYWLDQPPVVLKRLNNFMKVLHSKPWYEWMDVVTNIRTQLGDKNGIEGHDGDERLILVDVGGGKGDTLHRFRRQLNDASIGELLMLQDRAGVIEEILDPRSTSRLPGVTYLPHDFFEPQPLVAQGSMYYFLRHILHNWPDQRCIDILKGVAKAMKPGYSRLLINERVIRPMDNDLHTAGLDFHMAFSHASKERTLEEFRMLTEAAGLVITNHHQSPDRGEDVVECAVK